MSHSYLSPNDSKHWNDMSPQEQLDQALLETQMIYGNYLSSTAEQNAEFGLTGRYDAPSMAFFSQSNEELNLHYPSPTSSYYSGGSSPSSDVHPSATFNCPQAPFQQPYPSTFTAVPQQLHSHPSTDDVSHQQPYPTPQSTPPPQFNGQSSYFADDGKGLPQGTFSPGPSYQARREFDQYDTSFPMTEIPSAGPSFVHHDKGSYPECTNHVSQDYVSQLGFQAQQPRDIETSTDDMAPQLWHGFSHPPAPDYAQVQQNMQRVTSQPLCYDTASMGQQHGAGSFGGHTCHHDCQPISVAQDYQVHDANSQLLLPPPPHIPTTSFGSQTVATPNSMYNLQSSYHVQHMNTYGGMQTNISQIETGGSVVLEHGMSLTVYNGPPPSVDDGMPSATPIPLVASTSCLRSPKRSRQRIHKLTDKLSKKTTTVKKIRQTHEILAILYPGISPKDLEPRLRVPMADTHPKDRLYKCPCGEFHGGTKTQVRKHLIAKHFGDKWNPKEETECFRCKTEKKKMLMDNLGKHIVDVHLGSTTYECRLCEHKFVRREVATRHLRSRSCKFVKKKDDQVLKKVADMLGARPKLGKVEALLEVLGDYQSSLVSSPSTSAQLSYSQTSSSPLDRFRMLMDQGMSKVYALAEVLGIHTFQAEAMVRNEGGSKPIWPPLVPKQSKKPTDDAYDDKEHAGPSTRKRDHSGNGRAQAVEEMEIEEDRGMEGAKNVMVKGEDVDVKLQPPLRDESEDRHWKNILMALKPRAN